MGKPSVRALIWGNLRQWSLLECQNAHLQLGSKCSAHHPIFLIASLHQWRVVATSNNNWWQCPTAQLNTVSTFKTSSLLTPFCFHLGHFIGWIAGVGVEGRVIIGCVVSSWARLSLTFVSQFVFCTDHVSTKVSKGRFESIQNHTCGTFAQEFGSSS